MSENTTEPFLCLEVESFNNPLHLAKRLDELFPKRIIRLKIQGKYSPYFYIGGGIWVYKKSSKTSEIHCNLCIEESVNDLFNEEMLSILEYFNIKFDKLRLYTNLTIKNEEFVGYFFSDGNNHIFDQFIFENCEKVKELLLKHFEAETLINVSNDLEDGFLILKTEKNIFGDINDKSNNTKQ